MKETYHYTEHDNTHSFYLKDKDGNPIVLTDEVLEHVIYWYTSAGCNFSQETCVQCLIKHFDIVLTKAELAKIFSLIPGGITKDSPPISPSKLRGGAIPPKNFEQEAERIYSRNKAALFEKLQEVELRNLHKELATLRTNEFYTKIIAKAIKETVKPLPVGSFNITKAQNSGRAHDIYFSDWHVGLHVPTDKVSDGRGYDAEIFVDRLGKVVSEIIEEYVPRDPDTINVNAMGDLLDGPLANMRPNQGLEQCKHNIDQIKLAVDGFVWAIQQLSSAYNKPITINAISGNHDRLTPSRQGDPDRLGHWMMFELVIAKLENYIRMGLVKFVVPKRRWYGYNSTESVRTLINHGDNKAKPDRLFTADSLHPVKYRVAVQGHFHERKIWEVNNGLWVGIPSLCGPTEFSDGELVLLNRPGQCLVEIIDSPLRVRVNWLDVD